MSPEYRENISDEEIIIAYRNGNQEVFKDLIQRYTSHIYNFVARITNKTDATDIVQETFIKVWRNIERFDETKASFKTWIFTIAKNTTTDFLRKKRHVLFSDLEKSNDTNSVIDSFEENIPDNAILPDEALQKLEEKELDKEFLNNLLDTLSSRSREILVLHYQEEMTFEEIGKVLNKPLNTVKSIHLRAIRELQKRLI
jgi:RNA polymerase sigma-70 factor, ECF subfamily